MQLKPDTLLSIFLILLLILPGFFSQIIINSLIKKSDSINSYQTTYSSLLHSVVIYIIVYPLVILFFGVDIQKPETLKSLLLYTRWSPIIAIILLGILSFGWAILYVWIKKTRLSSFIQNKLGVAVEPPNIYARILNASFRHNHEPNEYWIAVKIGNRLVEGGVKYEVTNGNCREVYLTNVAYLDPDTRQEIMRLPEDTGVVIDLDKRCITEITAINGQNE